MAGPSGRAGNGVVAAAVLALSLNAHAAFGRETATPAVTETPTAPTAPAATSAENAPVAVEFQAAEGPLDVELFEPRGDARGPSRGRCRTPCRIQVPRGSYTLEVYSRKYDRIVSQDLEVSEPVRVWVGVDSGGEQTLGLLMIGSGVVATVAGAVLLGDAGCVSDDGNGRSSSGSGCENRLVGGIALVTIGPVLAGAGLIVALRGGYTVDTRRLSASARRVAPSAAGASLAFTGTGIGFRLAF